MSEKTVWTPAMDARLRELHATGAKFKLIARTLNAEFKVSLTRNAAIGRSHRLVLAPRCEPKKPAKPSTEKTIRLRRAPSPHIVPLQAPVVPGRLVMSQLTTHTCHWPDGDRPPYTYCGEPTYAGSSFCRAHYKRAYDKPRQVG